MLEAASLLEISVLSSPVASLLHGWVMGNEFGCAYQLPTDYKRRNQPDMIQLDTQLLPVAPDVGAKANDVRLENRVQELVETFRRNVCTSQERGIFIP